MPTDDRSSDCEILWRHDWTPHLFSIRTARPAGLTFRPGQFVRLGLAGAAGDIVWRAYSICSPPAADHLEFYSIVVPDGPFTQPLSRRGVGDAIRIDPTAYGFLRSDRFTSGKHLWLLATGTGIAPFLSMLADAEVWTRFERIVVVHSVRRPSELAYRDLLRRWADTPPHPGGTLCFLPTLTAGETSDDDLLAGRITTLLGDGRLEAAAGASIAIDESRLMICGNPSMIRQTRALLTTRGLSPVRRETPGQYISENFW